jgi:hypothetical protein
VQGRRGALSGKRDALGSKQALGGESTVVQWARFAEDGSGNRPLLTTGRSSSRADRWAIAGVFLHGEGHVPDRHFRNGAHRTSKPSRCSAEESLIFRRGALWQKQEQGQGGVVQCLNGFP